MLYAITRSGIALKSAAETREAAIDVAMLSALAAEALNCRRVSFMNESS
jgi:hypothetical protein